MSSEFLRPDEAAIEARLEAVEGKPRPDRHDTSRLIAFCEKDIRLLLERLRGARGVYATAIEVAEVEVQRRLADRERLVREGFRLGVCRGHEMCGHVHCPVVKKCKPPVDEDATVRRLLGGEQ